MAKPDLLPHNALTSSSTKGILILRSGVMLVLAISITTLIWFITVEPLDLGYPRFAGVADAMVRSGNWIVPTYHEKLYVHKPPLFIWLVAIPIALMHRVPEWAGHLPNVLAAGGILLMLYLLCKHASRGRGEAFLSCLLLATSFGFALQAREERLDMVFSCFLMGAFLCFYKAITAPAPLKKRNAWINECYLFLALAVMTKGPLGIIFFLAVTIPFAFWINKGRFSLEKANLSGYALFLLLISIWPVLFIEKAGWHNIVMSIETTEIMTRKQGPFFYFAHLPVSLLPWTFFLPSLLIWLAREKPWRKSTEIRFALCWFGIFFIILHFSSVKDIRYFLPAMPALALLTSRFFSETLPKAMRKTSNWLERLPYWMLFLFPILLIAVSFSSPYLVRYAVGESSIIYLQASINGIWSLIVFWWLWRKRDPIPAVFALGILMLLNYAVYDGMRAYEYTKTNKRAQIEHILAPITEGAPARTFGLEKSTTQCVIEMLTRREVPPLSTLPELKELVSKQKGSAYIVSESSLAHEITSAPGLITKSCGEFHLRKSDVTVLEVDFKK